MANRLIFKNLLGISFYYFFSMFTCSLSSGETLVVSRPLPYQVFQRAENGRGDVEIVGNLSPTVNCVEAKVTMCPNSTRGEAVDWRQIADTNNFNNGKFCSKLNLSAGGWYKLYVRAKSGNTVLSQYEIEAVGVGDIFITAGQSNSANFGLPRQVAVDSRVVYFTGECFVHAKDPIPGGFGENGSPWPILGDMLVRSNQVPVCFRSVTLTFAPVRDWLPDAEQKKYPLYSTLVGRTKWFGNNGVRAVLWHQGESDTLINTTEQEYFRQLEKVIESMRKDVGYNIDWYVAGTSYHPHSSQLSQKKVYEGQRLIWKKGIAFPGVSTDDLGPSYRHDGVHFNQIGLQTHAERWYVALMSNRK